MSERTLLRNGCVLTLDPAAGTLLPGESLLLEARPVREDGSPVSAGRVSWKTLVPEVAAVDSNGLVIAVAPGRTIVQATAPGGLMATAALEVAAAEIAMANVIAGERSLAPESGTVPAAPVEYEYPTRDREAAHLSSPAHEGRAYAEAEPHADARVYDWDVGTERRGADGGRSDVGTVGLGMSMGDTETGEFREHDRDQEGLSQPGSDLEDEDELRVQRSEEELKAGTRERQAGAMKVRKRVRTDREQIEVPTKHEEVSVERVPVSGEATEAQIGEDEVSVPVTEEEVVVDKRTVAKEEVRIRKDVVEDTEVVEDDVRREEVDIEDATTERGTGL